MEKRFCSNCMLKTSHEFIEENEVIYTYKRKRTYKCLNCGYLSKKRGLRPSSESVYWLNKIFTYVVAAAFDNGIDADGAAAVTFNIPIHPLPVNSDWCAWIMYWPG